MIRFLVRRSLHAVALVFVILTATFFVSRLAPGDPLNAYYDPSVDPRAVEQLRDDFGLDDPIFVQYFKVLARYASGDFGFSFRGQRPVTRVIADAIPNTLLLMGVALFFHFLIGLVVGVATATKKSVPRAGAGVLMVVLYSMPSFYLAFALIWLFALKLGWFPVSGIRSVADAAQGMAGVWDVAMHMVLPVAVLTLGSAASFARHTRGAFGDAFASEFIVTARAKGLTQRAVVWRHALRNTLPELLTLVGLSLPFLLGGSVVVEKIFAWPGMGALLVDSISARDYPVIVAVTVVGSVMVVTANLLADLSYTWADPRLRATELETGEDAK